MPADMVVEGCLYSGLKVTNTDLGLNAKPEKLQTDPRSTVASYRFVPQVKDESDVAKIRTPQVTYDKQASRQRFETMSEIFDGILPVRQRGVMARPFCPCDMLAERWGPEQFLLDLALKPDLVHAGMERMTEACIGWLAQWEELGVLALNNTNVRAGTGGLSYCDELPATASTRPTSAPLTCGAWRWRRYSRKSPRPCTKTSPCTTSSGGSRSSAWPTTAAASRSI